MRISKFWILGLFFFMLGCGADPLPADKLQYAGQWQGEGTSLTIVSDGSCSWQRIKGGATTTINGPIQEFIGNDFSVGYGFLSTTFVVSKPPTQTGGTWTMTVDGVELTRTQ